MRLVAAIIVMGVLTCRAVLAANGFFPSVPDLPLLDGFAEVSEETLVFDKPSGRIAIAVARGPGVLEPTRALYVETLVQLGWAPRPGTNAGMFEREGELLTLSIARDLEPGILTFEIMLAPMAGAEPR